jgi:poly-gamma-glutamate capsule biosynthesis protein CapA/YwtB (metallophosphatase superfamily)
MTLRTAVRRVLAGFAAAVCASALTTAAGAQSMHGGKTLSVLACGDILLARTPGKRVAEYGFRYPFEGVKRLVSEADIAFANLEAPASYIGVPYPGKPPNVTFRADPATLFGVAWAGFDVLSLANNHMNDFGPLAVAETLDFIDLLGIARCGAGRDLEEARAPAVIERDGARFVFLAYAEPAWTVVAARSEAAARTMTRAEERFHGPIPPPPDPATPSGTIGVALANIADVIADIRSARETLKPDYVFVSMHWGDEQQHYPSEYQRALGRAAIDAGATAVLGHHPHVWQSMERYKDGFIAYSLGNFVFDMAVKLNYETAALRLVLANGRITRVDVIPLTIHRGSYAPATASPAESTRRLADIARWSAGPGIGLRIKGSTGSLYF